MAPFGFSCLPLFSNLASSVIASKIFNYSRLHLILENGGNVWDRTRGLLRDRHKFRKAIIKIAS